MATKYSEVNQKKADELQKQIKAKDTEIAQASTTSKNSDTSSVSLTILPT